METTAGVTPGSSYQGPQRQPGADEQRARPSRHHSRFSLGQPTKLGAASRRGDPRPPAARTTKPAMKVAGASADREPANGGGGGGQSVDVPVPKKGGECLAIDGVVVVVQPGAYNPRKDVLTCSRVPAADRHSCLPTLRQHEKLWSDVYSIGGKSRLVKSGLHVIFPVRPLPRADIQDLHLRVKSGGEDTWQYCEFVNSEKEGAPCVEFPLAKPASFAITRSPKAETFTVTDQGLLYNAKISHYVSIRFPKKSIDTSQMDFSIQIHPLDQYKMAQMKEELSEETADFVAASDFYDILGPQMFFKRAITIKLGLPAEGFEEENADCISLLRQDSEGAWCAVEGQLKFTKTTVTFTTSHIGRFVVAKARPKRAPRLPVILPTVEFRNLRVRCDIVVSVKFDKKRWTMWVDAVALGDVEEVVARRESLGAVCVDKMRALTGRGLLETDEPAAAEDSFRGNRFSTRLRPRKQAKKEPGYLAFVDSAVAARLEVCGDLRIVEGEGVAEENPSRRHALHFCDALKENCRVFEVQPKKYDFVVAAAGQVNVYSDKDGGGVEILRSISVPIEARSIDEYYHVEVAPEPAPPPMDVDVVARPPTPEDPKTDIRPPALKFKPITPHLSRLAESKRAAAKPNKEPRVLSGRSLQALAGHVSAGLALAVHLGIPESTITGIGFDALSNGLGLPEVTYKMLLRWKRTGRASGAERVGQLSEALKAIGRVDVAALVWECHARSQELTADNLRAGHAAATSDDDNEGDNDDRKMETA